ncbi:MAG: hypothetical protein E5W76_19290, partial [Mesorhizobium sp.]
RRWTGRAPRAFHGNGEPLYLFVLTQFRTENRFTLFLELLQPGAAGAPQAGRPLPDGSTRSFKTATAPAP